LNVAFYEFEINNFIRGSRLLFMKLRYKLILIFVCIILIYSSIGYLLIEYMILPKNELLCHSMAMKDVERCTNVKNEYLNNLMTLVKNYAAWDDTYFFMQNKNTKEYINSNLNFTTFRDLNIDILMYYDVNGNLYWGNVVDIKSSKYYYDKASLNGLDKVIKEKYPHLLSTEEPRSGIIVDTDNSFLIASHPIIRPSPTSKEPPMGVIIMGVWGDKEFQAQLVKNILVNFELIPLNEENRQKYAANIEELNKAGGFYFESVNENEDAVYAYTLDINDKPALLFKAIFDRQIYSSNYTMIKIFLRIFIMIGIASMVLLVWIMQKIIIIPVLKLTENIVKIKTTKKYSVDVGTNRKDEIGTLTNQFNEMQCTLKEYDENLEKLVEIKTNDIMKSQKDTIIRLAVASEKKRY
jgi:sensor domain CHASE-containing protein